MPSTSKIMSAITTIANPLSVNHDKVMIFWSNKFANLGLENRQIGGDINPYALNYEEKDNKSPTINFPSQMASMVYKDAVCVFGITGDKIENLELALLSPVYKPEKGIKPVYGSLAGCVDSKGTGYLYLFATDPTPKRALFELTLSNEEPDQKPIPGNPKFHDFTNLFAFYDAPLKQRFLVYQMDDKTISIWSFKHKRDNVITDSIYRAKAETPLTACVVPADAATNRPARVYVYFYDDDNLLQSANCVLADTLYFTTNDEKPSTVGDGHKISTASQLSVFPDPIGKRNIIYGMKTANAIVAMYDEWRPT
ncbi:hypothetical protein B0T22DRAFT_514451 [Podospora appendiculata]|uniref:Uncharacterized protein n=1 Tax=Podospora appendiculata TaxID=314037 RepID=A0AAE0XC60_9PEZI|nr:hypothetical protein B0T22DRAFT_514451 [Podospora appendiculata]